MKVTVVGSGSMWNKYNSACYLIDNNIMVDFPNGACKYLYRLGIVPNKINSILLTHFHGDHYFDIPFCLLNKAKSENKYVNIYCSKEGKSKINKIGNLAFPNSFKDACRSLNLYYYNDANFIIDKYSIQRVQVDHGRMKPAYGYIFSNGSTNIGFTGDTTLCNSVEYMASCCKYLFCDCMFIKGTSKHMGIDMLKELSTKYSNCTFVVSHMELITRDELQKLNITNVIVPEDGTIINID